MTLQIDRFAWFTSHIRRALSCAPSTLAPVSLQRVAWSILECARRTSTFLLCAFREQEDDQAALLFLFYEERFRVFSRGGGDGQEDQAFFPAAWHGRGDAVVGLVKLSWLARAEGDAP